MEITIFTEKDLREHITINKAIIDAIADGFGKLAGGEVTMPPIMRLDIPEHNGEIDVKTAYIKGLDSFAVKMSPGFFDNHKKGLPSLSGMMVLFDAETGFIKAVHLDNGYLTEIRTAAAGAVAAQHLAPKKVTNVGVIGAGGQARYQIRALKEVRSFKKLLVYNRTPERAEEYVKEMNKELKGVKVVSASSPEEVVKESQVVITTTPATHGIIQVEWLHEGLHITAMGSDAEHKQELVADVFPAADLVVCDSKSQAFRLGELYHAENVGFISKDEVVELGEIVSGAKKGRTNDKQITICDLTGTGMQDTIIARMAFELATKAKAGTTIEN